MSKKGVVLILYTELAGYTLACLGEFCKRFPEYEIHLVRYPVNKEAPFEFRFSSAIKVYDGKSMSKQELLQLADRVQPSVILTSGWIDKNYLSVCWKWRKRARTILLMDNKWEGTLRQRIACVFSFLSVRRLFAYAWVPGQSQALFAEKLGFPAGRIRTGFYSADTEIFSAVLHETETAKQKDFPHRFIFTGRYYEFKGLTDLWDAFIRFKKETDNDWELWCLGTGDLVPVDHPAIRHFGFVQPEQLPAIMKQTGVFILPSRIEPWAVAVHEFAAAGFPLVLSNKVGAAETFLENGKNGFTFNAGAPASLLEALRKTTALSDGQLHEMGLRSAQLAARITPQTWAQTLAELCKQHPN